MVEEIKDECGCIQMLTCNKLLYKDNDVEYIVSVEGTFENERDIIVNLLFHYPVTDQIINKISEMTQKLFESAQMVVKVIINNMQQIQDEQEKWSDAYRGISKLAI